jgi:hypothetical protein
MKIIESSARTVSGSSNIVQAYGGESLRCQLNVVGVSGTTPTLNVVIEDSIDGVNYNTLASFPQKTAVGREILNITTPFAENLRASWTITGAAANFTFGVDWSLATRRGS